MHRFLFLGVALLLIFAPAAQAKRVKSIVVRGRVLEADGSPAVGARVTLAHHPGFGEALVIITSLGTACLVFRDICDSNVVYTKTDGAGRWRLRLLKHGTLATARDIDVDVGYPGRASDATSVTLHGRTQTLPDLSLWDARLTRTTPAPHQMLIGFQPLPDADGAEPQYDLVALDAKQRTTWEHSGAAPGELTDDRVLEAGDRRLIVSASAQVDRYGKVTYHANPLGLEGLAAPLSRGKPARRIRKSGAIASKPVARWTDGNLVTEVGDQADDNDQGVVIDLGSPQLVSAVVARECAFTCTVQTSTDGTNYSELGTSDSGDDVRLIDGVPRLARYVRWTSEFDIDYTKGTELSVW